MPIQTGQQSRSPITGKLKNCNTWAEYERPHNSPAAAMCNGGKFEGDTYNECPVKWECKSATEQKQREREEGKRYLPVQSGPGPERPFGSRTVVVSPSITQSMVEHMQRWQPPGLVSVPTKKDNGSAPPRRNGELIHPLQLGVPVPYPVRPPEEWPTVMRTTYAGPQPVGGHSPTFLPEEGESVWGRLFRNMAQGMVTSLAWHGYDYARSIDMFPKKKTG